MRIIFYRVHQGHDIKEGGIAAEQPKEFSEASYLNVSGPASLTLSESTGQVNYLQTIVID